MSVRRWDSVLLVVVLAVNVIACGSSSSAASGPPAPTVTVTVTTADGPVSAEEVASTTDSGRVVLQATLVGRGVSTSFIYHDTEPAVQFSAFSYPDQGIADMFLYGFAPEGATTFQIDGITSRSAIGQGLFVAVAKAASLDSPADYSWSFLTATGNLVLRGTGTL